MSDDNNPPPPMTNAPQPGGGWSQPPQPGQYIPPGQQPNSAIDEIIPVKNSKALFAYYCGIFALVPCFTPILGPAGLILGFQGLEAIKKNPNLPGKGHALAGIVLGGGMLALELVGLIIVLMNIKR